MNHQTRTARHSIQSITPTDVFPDPQSAQDYCRKKIQPHSRMEVPVAGQWLSRTPISLKSHRADAMNEGSSKVK